MRQSALFHATIKKKITEFNNVTVEFNKVIAEHFAARLVQANLVTKTDFDNKLINLNRKINSNKTKHLIVENELKNLETFESIYFRGKSQFEDDGTRNCLVFQTTQKYFKTASIIMIIFYHGNLKDCLMKILNLLLHLIIFLILYQTMLVLKQEYNLNEVV